MAYQLQRNKEGKEDNKEHCNEATGLNKPHQGEIMPAIFKVSPDEQGFFQFEFFDNQGARIFFSPAFQEKALADQAIQEVRVGSMMSQFISKGKTPEGCFFFLINNQSGDTVAKSVLFDNEMHFNNALHHVRDSACIAEVSYE